MGLPLYVAKSSSSEPDVKTKIGDKIPGPRRSVRRRARVNNLVHDSERYRARQRQRAAFFANYVNGRNSDDDRVVPRDRQTAAERADPSPVARSHRSYIGSLLDSIQGGSSELRDWDRADDDYVGVYSLTAALAGTNDPWDIDPEDPLGDIGDDDDEEEDDDGGGPGVWRDSRNTDGQSRISVTRERTSTHTVDPWELYLDRHTRHEETPGAARIDGLGDRERSLSPDTNGTWNTLLTTLAPDPQPPSAGSSFASVTAATATEQNSAPAAPAAPRHTTRGRDSGVHHECGFCDRCLRRRANIAALRSRGHPGPAAPLLAEMPPYLLHGRRRHRALFPTSVEASDRAGDQSRRGLSNDYNVVRRGQAGPLSTLAPDDDGNSQEDGESAFDVWTRRRRDFARRR